ncbi:MULTISPECIES: pentapeptide repeat-containing protein [unclassified Crossiella]|uniref:pentapeptide repeat-containing protein n=1 Tax=unclassified Crossiella TaxID=2620835 RepID=UPI001FFFF912|nr:MULTISPECIES: pentapeptide repeat-containing protein [unclassified Crossiella]MCK2241709.1 pentapeptide repeat-containing protein [Crossiella sp. S99.2]MCK2255419.1 pentapeptide repeat-containing protein [Crossiella sp. S99.1]
MGNSGKPRRRVAGLRRPAPRGWRRAVGMFSWDGWLKVTALLTSLATVAALWFTAESLRATRGQLGLIEQGQYTDRFGKAVEQLGSDKPAIRMGGLYALERLARDSARDHATIVEVLSAYVREHAPRDTCRGPRPAADVQTALTVLGRRDAGRDQYARIDWRGACLAGAELSQAHLGQARLDGVNLRDAVLRGANLTGAQLRDADLTNAYLVGTNLRGADLHQSRLAGAFVGVRGPIGNADNTVRLHEIRTQSPPVAEQRTVGLAALPTEDSVWMDYWRQQHDRSGDLNMDQTGISAALGAQFAVMPGTDPPDWERCRLAQNWVTRVEFAELRTGSNLCARTREGRLARLTVVKVPPSPITGGTFLFSGLTWQRD